MKKLHQLLTVSAAVIAFNLGGLNAFSQQPDWRNMDPQQMQKMIQQRMMENFRERLVVTNDAEWSVIEARLSKVIRLRTEGMFSSAAGMMGGMRGARGGGMGPGGGFRGFPGFGPPDPDAETLQNAVDSNSPTAQIKSALAKLRESRKQKQAELAKAQADLRDVLTTRQEATLVLAGMLD